MWIQDSFARNMRRVNGTATQLRS